MAHVVKNVPANARDAGSIHPWVRKILWRRKWQPSSILAWRIPWMVEPDGLYIVHACTPSLILCSPIDCNPPGSSVPGILQARTLGWVAISSSSWSSWPRDQTYVSCIVGRFFIHWATCGKLGLHSWGHKESDTIEHAHACARAHTHTHTPLPQSWGQVGYPSPHWRLGKGLARWRKVDSACTRVCAPHSISYATSHLNACSNSFLWTRLAHALSQALAL